MAKKPLTTGFDLFQTFIDTNEYCTTLQAAKALGVTRRTVQLWVDSKVLQAWKTPGGHMKIHVAAVKILLEQRKKMMDLDENQQAFNILYVEDDLIQQRLLTGFFSQSKSKINLRLASDGFEGLIALGAHTPDLLITDLNMPGMDGLEMLRHLKPIMTDKKLNVVVFTSMSFQEIEDKGGLPEGVKLFLKPINFKEFEPFIQSLITKK
jgi:excisionase family DNA binding protein